MQEMRNFALWHCRRKITDMCLFLSFFPPRGDLIKMVVLGKSEESLFGRTLKVLEPFLSDQKDWRAASPPSAPFFSKVDRSNYQDIHFLSMLESFSNSTFNGNMTPASYGERPVSYFSIFTYTICYWEVYRHILGGEVFVLEMVSIGRVFLGKGNFEVEFLEICTLEGFDTIPYINYFICLTFCLRLQFYIYCGDVPEEEPFL